MDANHAAQTRKYTCSHTFLCCKHLKNWALSSHCKPHWAFLKILTSRHLLSLVENTGGTWTIRRLLSNKCKNFICVAILLSGRWSSIAESKYFVFFFFLKRLIICDRNSKMLNPNSDMTLWYLVNMWYRKKCHYCVICPAKFWRHTSGFERVSQESLVERSDALLVWLPAGKAAVIFPLNSDCCMTNAVLNWKLEIWM